MNNNGFINIIDNWLRIKFEIKNGKYLCHKISGEQTFLNLFDFLFTLFKEINIKHIIINSSDLPKEDFDQIPLPALIINYDIVDENQVLGKAEMIENVNALKSLKNYFIVIAEESKSSSILLINVFLGIVNNWSNKILGGVLIILFLLGSLFGFFQLPEQIIFCLSLLGLIISQDLLDDQNEVQNKNSLVKKICGGGGTKSNSDCKKLSIQSSKVFNYLEWSEIGIFYFFAVLLNIIILGLSEYSFLTNFLVLFTSSVGVLFSFYSIYQQFRIKVFCRACSIIIAIFFSLFGISIFGLSTFESAVQLDLNLLFPVIFTCTIFLLSLTYVFLIKRWTLLKQKYSFTKSRLNNYTTDPTIFNRINIKKISDEDLGFLNKNSSLIYTSNNDLNSLIIFVCAHCPYCNQTLKEVYKDYIGSNLGVRIVHIPARINYESEEDAIKQASKMIAVLEKYDINQYIDLFEFNQKIKGDHELLEQEIKTKYPIENSLLNDSLVTASNILKITKAYKVDSYPTLLLNNTFVSNLYSLEELSLHF